ncbi:MAG: hypothetical protein C5B52_14555 [Bacteroidetes bacterium]|nr:MAG: hypothetical protein C5B52_14555 [Bacteroidota bacterium]
MIIRKKVLYLDSPLSNHRLIDPFSIYHFNCTTRKPPFFYYSADKEPVYGPFEYWIQMALLFWGIIFYAGFQFAQINFSKCRFYIGLILWYDFARNFY